MSSDSTSGRGYIVRRLLFLPVALAVTVTLSFLLVNALPGNPAPVIAGPAASDDRIEAIEARLGLDQPLWDRYVDYMSGLVRLDMGRSFYTDRPITDEIGRFLPNTLELVAMSLVAAAIVGVGLGTIASYWHRRLPDRVARMVVTVSQSIPDFFLALLLIYLFFYVADLAPAPIGRLGLFDTPPPRRTGGLLVDSILAGQWDTLRAGLRHSMLPVATLGFYYSSYFARATISSLLPALESKQVEFARAAGLRERTVLAYAFRQARTPILTYGGILLAALIGGAAIVETIFSWGGIGEWSITSIIQLDLPAIQGFIMVAAAATLVVFTVLDIIVALLDPRIRYG